MKKMKKLMALLMTVAMVMGMAMTTMAAENPVTITIKDENGSNLTGATLKYAQLITPDTTKRTGWAFTNKKVAEAYINAFGINAVDNSDADQQAIDKLIQDDGTSAAVAKALSTIINDENLRAGFVDMKNPQVVTSAGVYAIYAVQDGYTYNNMAAYVGFGPVENQNYPELTSTELTAKRTPTTIGKEVTDADKVVAIGDILTYTIKTTVPYIDPNHTDRTFKITDTITGADYYLTGDDSIASVQMGNDTVVGSAEQFDVTGNGFTIDLSELILDNNANAGKEIIVTYTAKVTEVNVNNQAGSHIGGVETDSKPEVNVYTGTITLTKYNEDETERLAGAGFEVRKNGSEELLTFTQETEGQYVYDPEGAITEVFTGSEGTLIIHGLDVGTYNFKETTAPEGYHIKNTPSGVDASATLELKDGKEEAEAIVEAETELTNTKLSSLPSTGGIGTTIFTIGGCVIMIVAAGLFFASRRKENQ